MNDRQEQQGDEHTLTPREKALAKEAAKVAISELSDEFFRSVGKTLVSRVFIFIGVAVIAYMVGKGWISPPK